MTDFFWNTFEVVVNFIEAFIIFYFICNLLKHDFKTLKGKAVYIFASVLKASLTTLMNYITLYDWWTSIINILGAFVISCALIKGEIMVKLFAAAIVQVVSIFSGNFVTGVLSVSLRSAPEQLLDLQNIYRIMGALMCQTLNIFLYSLILKFVDKTIFSLKKKEWILVISVLLISSLSFGVIQTTLNEAKPSEEITLMLMMCELGLFTLNIICLYITVSLNKSNRAAEDLSLKEQQVKHNLQYAEAIRSQYEEIRNIRHDIKQHLSVVGGLQSEGKYGEAQKYISEISSNIAKIEMFIDVGNDFVNAILNSKLSIAKSKGIEVLCSSSSNINGIDEYDLCNLIGNMLDNAIEAAEENDPAIVEVSISSNKYKLTIKVSNSIYKSVLNENPTLKTSKSHPDLHGFGIKSIKSISEKYNGNVDYYEEGLTFICRVELCKQMKIKKRS